ncbi:MAG: LPS export ABC transporter permease LptF [Gammaproteobacteria bacterium]|nr:LPS export ABC transporter permease LptF [Gammaproteobacteria bacterium]
MIIQRYIQQEILRYLLWLAGLLFLILASHRFVDYLADAAAGKLAGGLIFQMLGLKLLATLPTLLPVSLYLAVLLAYSRLLRDSELTIISAAGMGLHFQLQVAVRFTLLFAIPLAIIVFYLAPWAEAGIQSLQARAQQEADISGITAGQFREFGEGERIVYVEGLTADGRAMTDVFLQVRQKQQVGVLSSERARFDFDSGRGTRYIVFEDGHRYVGTPGQLDYEITNYATYSVLLSRSEPVTTSLKLESMGSASLLRNMNPGKHAELQWRISIVIGAFLLAAMAVLLNQVFVKQKQYLSVFIAMLVYFLYSNLLSISKTMLKRDVLSPWLGLWWVHLLMAAAIVFLIFLPYMRGWRWHKGPGDIKS